MAQHCGNVTKISQLEPPGLHGLLTPIQDPPLQIPVKEQFKSLVCTGKIIVAL
jgi:hypothetical protein